MQLSSKNFRGFLATILCVALFAPVKLAADGTQRTIQLGDILAWKRIQSPAISNDGAWFVYRVSPAEGDSEVVLRDLKSGKDSRFQIGELPRVDAPAGGPAAALPSGRDLAISDDGKWAAFLAYPSAKEAKALKKAKKPVQSRVILVELATGKKTEFEKVRRFAFSGEGSTALALLRYAPTPAGPAAPATPPASAGGGAPTEDRPTGADLLLYDLASGNELNVGNVADFAFDKKGQWLAWIIDATDKAGNGVELRNMSSGIVIPLDNAKASYKGLSWTEKGDGLATIRGVEDKAWEEKVYTMVAFRKFSANAAPEKIVFDPAKDSAFPKGYSISPNRNASWMADLSSVTFGIHELHAKKKGAKSDDGKPGDEAKAGAPKPGADDDFDKPDMVIWHYKDKRMQPMQQVQENADKNFSFLCEYRVSEKKFVRLADENLRTIALNPESKFATATDVHDYELDSNLSGRRFEDVYSIDLKTGDRKLAVKKARWVMASSPDGSHILYYDEGVFYTYEAATGKSYSITKGVAATFWDTEDDHNIVKPPTRVVGWAKDSSAVLITDDWDIWKIPAHGGTAVNLTVNGKKDKIRYRTRYRLDPDERGIDLNEPMYVNAYGEWTKKNGIAIIEPGKTAKMLSWDDASYNGLMKAKHADVYLYTRETVSDFPNYYLTGPTLANGQKITDANPQQKDFLWTKGSRLIEYTSDKGDKLQGALYLPANYEPGKSYPTIVYIYEKLSQGANTYPHPTYNGFNIAAYTSNGYAVLTPDIVYKVNDPGMSAVWCVVPAVKAAIATGVVDAKRVGIHGHSWGGYQTAFLVTQTNIFAAAIAGAPLTDMIAMYNAIYWNTGSANQPIFESSQGRFTGSPAENMEAYIRNSPVYHAKNVTTPLIILHNDKDGAVDWTQGIEYFNTLRRMGKPVVMLQYKGENHGLRKPENMKDYTVRMKEFFDYRLTDKEPPKWLIEGVPLLQMKDHIEERTKAITKSTTPATPAASTGSEQP